MKKIIVLLLLLSQCGYAQSEHDYMQIIHSQLGGQLEYTTTDGCRADLVTSTHAYEADFASKWKESIGQALWYAIQTNKKAGIILIMRGKKDYNYVQKLQSTIDHNRLSESIDVLVYPIDFDEVSISNSFSSRNASTKSNNLNKSATGYWLTKNSKKRHNSICKWYNRSKGYFCSSTEGIPAKCCGG